MHARDRGEKKICEKGENCIILQIMSDLLNFEAEESTAAVPATTYTEDDIRTLDPLEHIRTRPGMYIGKLGDGSSADDGIYVLLKEVVDNAIDEYTMGFGSTIEVTIAEGVVSVRDYGRGIPLGKLIACSSTMNTGAKYDSAAFKKSVGLNGVGIKAVNALSSEFEIKAVRDGQSKLARFSAGTLLSETDSEQCDEANGTFVQFHPDSTIFTGYEYREEYVEALLRNYTYLNTGLVIMYNGRRLVSRGGLFDLLSQSMAKDPLYPIIHLKGTDIEVAITHANQYGEEYYSFVNGQHTTLGGTHLTAFKEAVSRTIKEHFNRSFEYSDIRNGIVAAVAVKVEEPVFESQTKTKLGSRDMAPDGPTVAKFVGDFIKKELDDYLHRNLDVAEAVLRKVQESERDRKAMAGVTKLVRDRVKKVSIHNRKLIDCNVHLTDTRGSQEKREATSIFLTEGDSAGGSITKVRDADTQAVFMLKGKPFNSYGASKKTLYENEELNLLMSALNVENGIENLRYNKVIIATDADVDGMHIRLLLLTFFLQFFPDLIKEGHVYVLQTPLFRVRNSQLGSRSRKTRDAETYYCYNDEERISAINRLGDKAEITRFKGLGEISPDEFRDFIGPEMRLDRVTLRKDDGVDALLEFYMGKNTTERQEFIINNLVTEDDQDLH